MTKPSHNFHLLSCGDKFPMQLHNNSIEESGICYGAGISFFIPSFRGRGEVDPTDIVNYIKSLPDNRLSENPSNVKYQDKPMPHKLDGAPENETVRALGQQIMRTVSTWTGSDVKIMGNMWSITHGYMEQTFPHDHSNRVSNKGVDEWACVYWAQVPEGSGSLELYPNGVYYGSITIDITPKAGDFFIFPGTLLHGVRHNVNKTEERISVSCNIESFSD